jgi:hypothetical protein
MSPALNHLSKYWNNIYNLSTFVSRENLAFAVMAEVFGNWKAGDQHAQWKMNPLVQWLNEGRPGRQILHGGHNNDWNLSLMKAMEAMQCFYLLRQLDGFYGVCADADSGHDGALHNNRLQAVSHAFQGELKRWAHGFGDHEVEAAKNALLVKLESALSDPVARADNLAVQAAQAGVVMDTSATARTLSKIDAKFLRSMVEKYIYDQDFAMAYYGATEGMPELSQARSRGWDFMPKFS